ncbi:MAG: thioredoxin family protein, partial [Bdellovibrionota bacterium]
MKDSAEHPFFKSMDIEQLSNDNFEKRLAESSEQLVGIFFWGHDCPNCEVAKNMLHQEVSELTSYGLKWFHVNVYENFELGTKFGLFGIPTFLFFHKGKKLGKITPFPGTAPFFEALRGLV